MCERRFGVSLPANCWELSVFPFIFHLPSSLSLFFFLFSFAGTSLTGKTSFYDSLPTKATSQGALGSLREELFPAIPSPPPIRRSSLPLNTLLNPDYHIVPLMLDDSLPSERSPSSQESSSSEALTFSVQAQR